MNLPDLKQLKKLANACRKAGITHYKGEGFEFTLGALEAPKETSDAPIQVGGKVHHGITDVIESDELTEDEKLFWSVQDAPEDATQ